MNNKKIASIELNRKKLKSSNESSITNHLKLIIDAFTYAGIAYLFSFVWFGQVMNLLSLNYQASYYWSTKLIITVLIILIVNFPKIIGLGFLGLTTLSLLVGLIFKGSFAAPLFNFISLHTSGIINSFKWIFGLSSEIVFMPQYTIVYIAYLSILIALFLIYIKPLPIILTIIWVAPYIAAFQFGKQDFSLIRFFLGLACIAITFSRQSSSKFSWRKVWQIPPVLLLALLLGFVFTMQSILPQDLFYNEKINRFLEQMIKSNQKMSDTVHYYEFSIRDAGFYPQEQQLGGPIEQKDQAFMNFYGPARPVYLRGTVFKEFDKNIWQASSMNINYLFYNEDPIKQQAEAFAYPELSNLKPASLNNYFTDEIITISPIFQPVQAVFHGGKAQQIINNDLFTTDTTSILKKEPDRDLIVAGDEKDEILYYFNPDGQIYASKEIPVGGYTVVGQVATIGSSANYMNFIQNDLALSNIAFAEQTSNNSKNYRNFLENMEPNLAEIVYQTAEDDSAKGAQLSAIINYLKTNFTYDLDVEKVPANQDFFEHFISTKKGYCTYFATALTVLSQEAGFEARYVEGFVVQGIKDHALVDDNYQRIVSTDQAHAWTEIKFDQLGWLALDATPSSDLNQIQTDQEKEEELRTELAEPEETQATETQTTQSLPRQQPTSQASSSDLTENEFAHQKLTKTILYIFGFLLSIIIIILYLIWKRRLLSRRHQKQWLNEYYDHDHKEIVIYIWQDLKYLYKLNVDEIDADQTILNSFKKMRNIFNWTKEDSYEAYQVIDQTLYAEKQLEINDIDSLLRIYQQAEDVTKENLPKGKWFLKRFLFSNKPKL